MSADKEKSKTNQKKIVWIFWAFMAIAIFLVLKQMGYSDGDDTYFYHYSTTMGFFEYLSWRYQTWVGRMAAEAIVYITFNLGLGFWRVADAVMMVLLPIGILRLGCKTAGYTGYTALLNEYQEGVGAVSYTHLDVYKRQGKYSWNFNCVCRIFPCIVLYRRGKELLAFHVCIFLYIQHCT